MADEIRRWSDELARDPASLVFLQLGEALRRQGQLDVALKIAMRGLERHPRERRSARSGGAHRRRPARLRARVRASGRWCCASTPDHVGAMKGLGYVCFQQGRFADAERYLGQAAAARRRRRRDVGARDSSSVVRSPLPSPSSRRSDRPAMALRRSPRRRRSDGAAARRRAATCSAACTSTIDGNDLGAGDRGAAERHLRRGRSRRCGTSTWAIGARSRSRPRWPSWRWRRRRTRRSLVVAASRSTPLGLLRRLLDRCAERAARWLGAGRRGTSARGGRAR